MSTLSDQTRKGVHWLGAIKIIQQAMSWIVTVCVARVLLPEDYGLMGIAIVVIGFSKVLTVFGLSTAIIQKDNLLKIEIDTIFWITVSNGIIAYIIISMISPLIASFFSTSEVIPVLKILGFNFILGGVAAVPIALMTKELKFREKSISELVGSLISNLLILLCAFSGFGVWSLVIGSICNSTIVMVLVCYLQKFIPHFQFSFKKTLDIIKFGAHIVSSRLLWYLYSKSDFIIIGKFLNKDALGEYSVAFQIASIPIDKIAAMINPVAYASFSKLQHDLSELKMYFIRFTQGLCFVLFPVLGGLAMIANEFVTCILTDKWGGIVFPLQCLCLIGFVRVAVQPIASLLNALGKAHLNLSYNLLNAFVMPLSFFIGVKINGITGVIMAWILVYPILSSYILFLGLREIGMTFTEYARGLFPIIASTAIMVIATLLMRWQLSAVVSDWFRLLFLILTGVVSYVSSLSIISPRYKDDFFLFFSFKEKS